MPLISGLKALVARNTGNPAWENIRPPHLPLTAEQAEKAWAAWTAAGAIPLPGMPAAKAAAE